MILGVIPARGGSKEIPRKNIKTIAGKPLIAWTIEAAKRSTLLDRYIVSTEDEEIAEISRKYGAKVLPRPLELAMDEALTLNVLEHAVKQIPCDTVVLLQPTSPIRKAGLIDECIGEFLDNGYDSLATGFMCKYMEYGKDVECSQDGKELRRQDIQGFFYDDGNVYVIRADIIRKGERYGKKIGRKIISRWENVEIDDEFDLWMTERILRENKHK
ncbi:MAG: acylneuraminate cytidylyltransferase family protein [Candidatus Omnitrophota bacterium]|nr:MAG: acylneuraminate cytidylyltransferase family protein [Candidatus Omnitrophota bacterium]